MTALELKLQKSIKESMIAKNTLRTQALRAIKARFDILNSSGQSVTEDEQMKVIQKMIKERKDVSEIYLKANRMDLYSVEISEAEIIQEFLPKQLSRDEVIAEVRNVISEMGATSISEMGKVIGATTKRLAGSTDGKTISEIVKEILQ